MLSFLFAHLARILAHGVAVRGKTFELEFNKTYHALARELRVSQLAAAAAPPSCGRGLCVGALSSDFDLRRANTSTPLTFSSGDVFVRQNNLYCERARATHEWMEHKCLSMGLLQKLELVDPTANLYCAFAGEKAVDGWPAFKRSEMEKTLKRAPHAWVLKSATDQASKNVLVMNAKKWKREGWNTTAVVEYAADVLTQPTMAVRCPTTKGHERRAVMLQRLYPWTAKKKWSEAHGWHIGTESFMFEVKLHVVWGKIGSAICWIHMAEQQDQKKQLHLYFDEDGRLSLGDKGIPGQKIAYIGGVLQRAVDIVRRAAPMLQQTARTLSRIFAADYWRLDVFLADGAPPHINEVTYPSFLGYDARDLQRLQAGYARVGRTIVPVPASCVANRLEKLILEKDWKEASGGLASFSSFQRLFGRLFSSGAAPACSPYLRQLS